MTDSYLIENVKAALLNTEQGGLLLRKQSDIL